MFESLIILKRENKILKKISGEFKHKTQAQLQSHQLKYEKSISPKHNESTIIEKILEDFDAQWNDLPTRLKMISGKEFLATLNTHFQSEYKITVTNTNIINSLLKDDISDELKSLLEKIDEFRKQPVN